ncbi:MAG: hypothetical protein LBB38_00830 [Puniceicoccales bacterium]|jgi:hypothetical protein|nr:hypothetical protein [Puniceicoccales bacterium]
MDIAKKNIDFSTGICHGRPMDVCENPNTHEIMPLFCSCEVAIAGGKCSCVPTENLPVKIGSSIDTQVGLRRYQKLTVQADKFTDRNKVAKYFAVDAIGGFLVYLSTGYVILVEEIEFKDGKSLTPLDFWCGFAAS